MATAKNRAVDLSHRCPVSREDAAPSFISCDAVGRGEPMADETYALSIYYGALDKAELEKEFGLPGYEAER